MKARSVKLLTIVAWGALALGGCRNHDLGTQCPDFALSGENAGDTGGDGEGSYIEGQRAVEIDATFPCDSAVCVATPARGAYCSRPCNDSGGCPSGFACEIIVDIGEYASRTYCVWAPCLKDSDCGDNDFECRYDTRPKGTSDYGVCGFK